MYVAIVLVGMMSMVGGMTFVGRRYLIAASVRICKREAVLWRCLREDCWLLREWPTHSRVEALSSSLEKQEVPHAFGGPLGSTRPQAKRLLSCGSRGRWPLRGA